MHTGFFSRLSFLLLAGLTLVISTTVSSVAAEPEDLDILRKEEQAKLQRKISDNQIKIRQLQTGIEEQREGIKDTERKERSILSDIEDLDKKLSGMTQRLSDLEYRMEEQQNLITSMEGQLQAVREKSKVVQDHVEKRISAYYKLGKIDLMNITFSARTMPELLRFHDSFQKVIEYDQQVMTNYHTIIRELESTRESLSLEKGLLEEFIHQAQDKKNAINEAKAEKQILLENVKTQAELHEQTIEELKNATQQLAESILSMKTQERIYDQGFLLHKGQHILPVDGIVSSLFDEERENHFGIKRKSPGISIDAQDGIKIRAIFDGEIIFAGYLKGYGNTVIIDHGYGYFTVTSRIERLLVKKESKVLRNDIIGITGSTATILDSGIYFEIRNNDQPLDPIEWLDRDQLKFTKDIHPPLTHTSG